MHKTYITIISIAILSLYQPVCANSIETPSTPEKSTITTRDAVILGLIEGFTEYLPVSSTGHLIIANRVLGLDSEDAENFDNAYTLKQAADAYIIIIQVGAILAVLILYNQRIITLIAGVLGKNPDGAKLAKNLIIAFLPAAVFGFLLDDIIDRHLFNLNTVIIALIGGSILMLIFEFKQRRKKLTSSPDIHELSVKQALSIGLLQCIAMIPGTSRSMMTIVAGYAVGLAPVRAAEFSFLLGLITLSAASGYKILTHGSQILQVVDITPLIIGILVAAVSAAVSVKFLVTWLTRYGLSIFAYYRILLAILLFLYL